MNRPTIGAIVGFSLAYIGWNLAGSILMLVGYVLITRYGLEVTLAELEQFGWQHQRQITLIVTPISLAIMSGSVYLTLAHSRRWRVAAVVQRDFLLGVIGVLFVMSLWSARSNLFGAVLGWIVASASVWFFARRFQASSNG